MGVERAGDALRVIYVAPASPAATDGLKIGDTIVAINGTRLDDAYFRTRPHEGSKPPGTVLRLTLDDGSAVNLHLADYY